MLIVTTLLLMQITSAEPLPALDQSTPSAVAASVVAAPLFAASAPAAAAVTPPSPLRDDEPSVILASLAGGAGSLAGLGVMAVGMTAGAMVAGSLSNEALYILGAAALLAVPVGAGLGAAVPESLNDDPAPIAAFFSATGGSLIGALGLGAAGLALGESQNDGSYGSNYLGPVFGLVGLGVGAVLGGAAGAGIHAAVD